jgi:hypothetical protein
MPERHRRPGSTRRFTSSPSRVPRSDTLGLHRSTMFSVVLWMLAALAVIDVLFIWSALVVGRRSDRGKGEGVQPIPSHRPEIGVVAPGPGRAEKGHRFTAV